MMDNNNTNHTLSFVATWNNTKYPIHVADHETVATLKETLATLTNVPPNRQKLLGFVKGKLPDDSAVLSTLSLKPKPNSTTIDFMLMGTPDANLFKDPDQVDLPDVINDLGYDYFPEEHSYMDEAKVKKKLRDAITKTEINIINPLREGKRLLVMDLDYTLFDCKSVVGHISELMRPGMHSFLAFQRGLRAHDVTCPKPSSSSSGSVRADRRVRALRYCDLESDQLAGFGGENHRAGNIVLDINSMISITTRKSDGKDFKHQVKPLGESSNGIPMGFLSTELIWAKYPSRFSAANTIHVDDLSRNFALNPGSGLKISAFKNAPVSRHTDRELVFVARYLVLITGVSDFRVLNHKKWKSYPGVSE
ncbi:hypothetical protein BC936DRAFT_138427 [Jimgerdemannia flammicorona]|uniref:Ubiquitin-like domain-containing protein n=1 Tax=Jimgerdemannia flammicorona TaxID=994334 RepID=A0A433CHJ2_9FUNG|nr:hypothetical protein BC936DRAFT_138427 [Jimgerdemannia flammicorona]